MGEVYVVWDVDLRRPAVLKTIRADLAADAHVVELFVREAEVVQSVKRAPHVVTTYLASRICGRPCLVMEYVDGGNLRQLIGRVDLPLMLRLSSEFCSGMLHLHRVAGVVHRDIKPENVLIDRAGHVKITDFGLGGFFRTALQARVGRASAADAQTACGTWAYMSPEHWRGTNQGPWSDIYSFGAMLHEMIVGSPPFDPLRDRPGLRRGELEEAFRQHHLLASVPGLRASRPDVPARLQDLVWACLEKHPNDRPGSFGDIHAVIVAAYHDVTGQDIVAAAARPIDLSPLFGPSGLPDPAWAETGGDAAELGWHVLRDRGVVAWREGRLQSAVDSLTEAARLNPLDVGVFSGLGNALAEAGRHVEALTCWSRCCALAPHMSEPHANMGNSYMALGAFAHAVRAFEHALRLDPADRVALGNIEDARRLCAARERGEEILGLRSGLADGRVFATGPAVKATLGILAQTIGSIVGDEVAFVRTLGREAAPIVLVARDGVGPLRPCARDVDESVLALVYRGEAGWYVVPAAWRQLHWDIDDNYTYP
jgi:serine/threonine protein kinase